MHLPCALISVPKLVDHRVPTNICSLLDSYLYNLVQSAEIYILGSIQEIWNDLWTKFKVFQMLNS